jgi:hypothetical protein
MAVGQRRSCGSVPSAHSQARHVTGWLMPKGDVLGVRPSGQWEGCNGSCRDTAPMGFRPGARGPGQCEAGAGQAVTVGLGQLTGPACREMNSEYIYSISNQLRSRIKLEKII